MRCRVSHGRCRRRCRRWAWRNCWGWCLRGAINTDANENSLIDFFKCVLVDLWIVDRLFVLHSAPASSLILEFAHDECQPHFGQRRRPIFDICRNHWRFFRRAKPNEWEPRHLGLCARTRRDQPCVKVGRSDPISRILKHAHNGRKHDTFGCFKVLCLNLLKFQPADLGRLLCNCRRGNGQRKCAHCEKFNHNAPR